MSTTRKLLLAGLGGLWLAATPVLAHHGYSAYDMTKVVSLKGTITSYRMVNPHSQIAFDVKGTSEVEHWVVETGPPLRGMKAAGFTRDTFKPGDLVTIYFNPSINGSHIGVLNKVEYPDGRVFTVSRQAEVPGATP